MYNNIYYTKQRLATFIQRLFTDKNVHIMLKEKDHGRVLG